MIAKLTKEFAKFSLGAAVPEDDLVYVWADQFTAVAHEIALIDSKRVTRVDLSEIVQLQLRHGFSPKPIGW